MKTMFVVLTLAWGFSAQAQSLTSLQAQACQQDAVCARALVQAQTVGLDAANAADYVEGLARQLNNKKNAG